MADSLFSMVIDLPRDYNKLGVEIHNALADMVENAANDIRDNARDAVPVDTGNLKGSLQADTSRKEELYAEVGTDVDYAIYVELGTHKAAAQPFFIPAVSLVRGPFLRSCQYVLKHGLGG